MKPLACLGLLLAVGAFGCCAVGLVLLLLFSAGTLGIDPSPMTQPAPLVQPVTPPVQPAPAPVPPPCPGPNCPQPPPRPNRPPRPWGPRGEQSVDCRARGGKGLVHDGPVHDGQEVQIDLPADILKRNIASKGVGCCVFRSINYCGLWQNVPQVIDLPEKMVQAGIEGGGWPEKVDRIMKQFAPDVPYLQIQNGDWDVVRLALKTGRCVAITYGSAHMVCLVKLENGAGCYRDNNKVGPNELEWGSEQLIMRHSGGSRFWAVVLLAPRPPAPPRAVPAVQELAGNPGRRSLASASIQSPRLPGFYEWQRWPNRPDQFALWHDGRQSGTYTAAGDYYQELDAPGKWGKVWRRPPVPLPADALARLEAMPVGVRREFLAADPTPRYSLCGQPATREDVMQALEDDSAKLSLTAIGAAAETAKVKADLDRPEFRAFKGRVLFQAYTPDNWAISPKRYGFDTSGHPTVYLETPDGKPLWHTNEYQGVLSMRALRQKDPNYRPDADPGMPNPTKPDTAGGDPLAGFLVLAAAFLGIVMLCIGIGVSCGMGLHFIEQLTEATD